MANIHSLAKVEIEIIYQYLDIISLALTSRCCRSMHTDMDSKIVFKYQPAFNINFVNPISTHLTRNHPYLIFEGYVNEIYVIPKELIMNLKSISVFNPYGMYIDELAIIKFIEGNTNLITLDLQYNQISSIGVILLFKKVISNNLLLTHLDLSCNRICNVGATAILETLKTNHSLTYLNLKHNNISDTNMAAIDAAIAINESKLLDL